MAIFVVKKIEALGRKQETVKLKIDNTTDEAFSNSTLKERRTKTWNMRWWWLQDNLRNNHFIIYLDRGTNKKEDYPTKHFPQSYHQPIRPKHILKGYNLLN